MEPATFDFIANINPNIPEVVSDVGKDIRKLLKSKSKAIEKDGRR